MPKRNLLPASSSKLPRPATLRPTFFTPIFLVTSFNFSFTHLCPLLFFDRLEKRAWHNTIRSSSIKGVLQFSLGIFDVSTKCVRVPCCSGRKVITSSPSVTSASSCAFWLELGSTIWCTTLNCANSPEETKNSCIVQRNEGRQGFRNSFLTAFSKGCRFCSELVSFSQVRDMFQSAAHVVAARAPKAGRNHLLVRRAANLQGEQSVRFLVSGPKRIEDPLHPSSFMKTHNFYFGQPSPHLGIVYDICLFHFFSFCFFPGAFFVGREGGRGGGSAGPFLSFDMQPERQM